MGKWIFGGLFCGVAAIFIVAGIVMIVRQDRAIQNARPMKATITTSEVKESSYTSKGRRRTRYTPVIRYTYDVDGKTYPGERIQPGGFESSSGGYARQIVAKFPINTQVEAFYDQRDPSSSFLLKIHDFGPYLFVLFPMIHMAAGVLVLGLLSGSKNQPPAMRPGGRWELPSGMPIGQKFKRAALLAGGWYGVGALAVGHFFSVAQDRSTLSVAASAIYFAIGILPLSFAIYYFLLKSKVSDAVITIDCHPVRRGQPVNVRVKVDVASGGRIESATLAMVCKEDYITSSGGKSRTTTRDVWSAQQPIARPQDLTSDRALNAEVRFTPPSEHPASTPKGTRGYPKHRWELALNIKRSGPDYRATFPLEVV